MANEDISALIRGIIEIQVIQALNSAPDAIDKLVKAALSKPVDDAGKFDGYGTKMPYLDWMVGQEIRSATRDAVKRVILERTSDIDAQVRAGLSAESIVTAVTKSLIRTAEQEWRITVNFEAEKKSGY